MPQEYQIGKRIKAIREDKGLSQSKVVEKLKEYDIKMSRETLSKIENNSRSVYAIELKALSKVLDADINDFFHEEEAEDMVLSLGRGSFLIKHLRRFPNYRRW